MNIYPKSQITTEFMVLVGLAIMMSIILISLATSQINDLYDSRKYLLMRDVALRIQNEIISASKVQDGYIRQFKLPTNINNKNYDILINGNALTIRMEGIDYNLIILDITGNLNKGTNTIKKTSGVIQLNP